MYIKIKHEKTDGRSAEEMADSFIAVADDATIIEVKRRIASCVRVPAERQEIRTLVRKFDDNEKFCNFLDLPSTKDCVSLMLYGKRAEEEEDNWHPNRDQAQVANMRAQEHFICFLLIYNDQQAALQKQHEENFNKGLVSSSQSSGTLMANSEKDDDESEADDDAEAEAADDSDDDKTSSSSDSSSSGSSSDSATPSTRSKKADSSIFSPDGSNSRKRSKKSQIKSKIPEKRSVGDVLRPTMPPRLMAYMDDSLAISPSNENHAEAPLFGSGNINANNGDSQPQPNPNPAADNAVNLPQPSPPVVPRASNNSTERPATRSATRPNAEDAVEASGLSDSFPIESRILKRAPYADISPEQRDFLAVISSDERRESEDYNFAEAGAELMNFYFVKLLESPHAANLQFNTSSDVLVFQDVFWISCGDKLTLDWMIQQTQELPKPFRAKSFAQHFNLIECTAVLPGVSKSRDLLEVFELLEKQNASLDTTQWAVQKRRTITANDAAEFAKRRVSAICPNELLYLLIDNKTKELLQTVDNQLKYCFWKISFEIT